MADTEKQQADAVHTPGLSVVMTGEDGETWMCRVGNRHGRITNHWPTKQAADKEAERLRDLMGGTSMVCRVSALREGSPATKAAAKATGAAA